MARVNRPRHGSKAYHPRKKADDICPSLKNYQETDQERIEGFLGYKAGMTHVMALDTDKDSPSYGQEIQIPVTVIECPKLKIYGVRTYKDTPEGLKTYKDIHADNIDKELERKLQVKEGTENKEDIEENKEEIDEVRLMTHTQPKEAELKKKPEVLEIPIQGPTVENRLERALELLGKEISVKDPFNNGEFTDIIGVTKGKGTKGPVQRFGIKKQVRKAKKKIRHPGSLGGWSPSRVLWTVAMSGQEGFHKRTELNKRILQIGENQKKVNPDGGFKKYGEINNEYILIKGSVPGPQKRPILLRHAVRPPQKKKKPEINTISTTPQQ